MTKKTVKAPVLRRVAAVEDGSIDVEKRTVKVAFASEIPYMRAFGNEILNVEAKSIDTSYLDNGAAVLVNHDWDDLVGVVTDYSIDPDRIARAVVKFGRSPRAQEIFQDVTDGIRKQISFGYMVKTMEQADPIEGVPSFRVTSFVPFEVSFVSVAADSIGAGVGKSLSTRDFNIEVQDMDEFIRAMDVDGEDEETLEEKASKAEQEEQQQQTEGTEETPAEEQPEVKEADEAQEETKAEEEAAPADDTEQEKEEDQEDTQMRSASVSQNDPRLEAELARVSTLTQLGEKLKAVDIAKRCIEQGLDIETFKQLVLQSKGNTKMEIGLTKDEAQRFSLIRAINAQLSGNWEQAGFEREVHEATATAMLRDKRAVNGIAIPFEVLTRASNNASNAGAGGNTIQTNVLGGSFIELLYNALVLPQLGATFIEANSPFSLPKASRGKTAAWVDENGVAPSGSATWTQVPFTPKRVADSTQISKRLLAQSTVDIEAMLMADFAKTIALAIQDAAINGDGQGNTPLGLMHRAIQSVPFASAAPTRAEIVRMEGLIEDSNLAGNGFLVAPLTKSTLKSTPLVPNFPQYLMDGNEMIGYPVAVSKVAAADTVLFGSWADLVIAHFGSLDICVDKSSSGLAKQNLVEVVVGMDADVNVRREESFVKGHA